MMPAGSFKTDRWVAATLLILAIMAAIWLRWPSGVASLASARSMATEPTLRVQRAQPVGEVAFSDQLWPVTAGDRQRKTIRFQGKNYRQAGTLRLVVTAYCPNACCCGDDADGVTASGRLVQANRMRLVAADTKLLPFGTLVSVPGYHDGTPVPVWDRGGKIKGYRLDVLMPTHAQAKAWGRQSVDVPVWRPVSD